MIQPETLKGMVYPAVLRHASNTVKAVYQKCMGFVRRRNPIPSDELEPSEYAKSSSGTSVSGRVLEMARADYERSSTVVGTRRLYFCRPENQEVQPVRGALEK